MAPRCCPSTLLRDSKLYLRILNCGEYLIRVPELGLGIWLGSCFGDWCTDWFGVLFAHRFLGMPQKLGFQHLTFVGALWRMSGITT